jgi:hypothetical protein
MMKPMQSKDLRLGGETGSDVPLLDWFKSLLAVPKVFWSLIEVIMRRVRSHGQNELTLKTDLGLGALRR